ncbi:hypothetical protein [uncultured Litoreibacter sp.]|uniref:hypothetical protein n=1 Tax=uncultured Litoreibacter sp. TaxID=1392394 RepID=UPI00261C69C8|nr:hypothetical protein [uncultured Litoreibacter sp.]
MRKRLNIISAVAALVALGACAPLPEAQTFDLRKQPAAGLTASQYLVHTASQAAVAQIIADDCLLYSFDEAAEDRLVDQTVELMTTKMSYAEAQRSVRRAMRLADASIEPIIERYITETGADFSNAASICRLGHQEKRLGGTIGSMLKRGT